ncbi:MAG: hypothetical protein ABEK36_01105 [Candidatus Aenigmatarchaeota archaeon]
MNVDPQVIDWLLQADPSVAFQTKRDVLALPASKWKKDQQLISTQGWGKKLLDQQHSSGKWGIKPEWTTEHEQTKGERGLYSPKYISTHYTLLILRRFEMLPNDHTTCGCRELAKLSYFQSVFDPSISKNDLCIPGMILGIFAHFQFGEEYFDPLLAHFEEMQMEDGGWNCRLGKTYSKNVHHFSVNTTLSILESLAILAQNYPKYHNRIKKLRDPAHEVLLEHELYKSHQTGEVIHPNFIDITFPPRWRYNILSALDYFRSIYFPYDDRMADALKIVKNREKKGFWPKGRQLSGDVYFKLDVPRKPSFFNTLRALRVLKTYT